MNQSSTRLSYIYIYSTDSLFMAFDGNNKNNFEIYSTYFVYTDIWVTKFGFVRFKVGIIFKTNYKSHCGSFWACFWRVE